MVTKKCLTCGIEFKYHKCREKAGQVRFCSRKCSAKYQQGENSPSWKGGLTKCSCLYCNKEFMTKPKNIRNGAGKFCSRSCAAKFHGRIQTENKNKNRVKKNCVVCGADIFIKASHVKIEGTYCSRDCMTRSYKIKLMGKNNPNYRNAGYEGNMVYSIKARNQRKESRKIKTHSQKQWLELKLKYDHRCAKCKKKEPRIKLTKDHIVPVTKGGHNGIDNIQPLCQRCNVKKFNRTVFYPHQLTIAI